MSKLDPVVRERTDALDMLGNTTAATGKGFAIGSAALTAMALLASYIEELRIWLSKIAETMPDKMIQVGNYMFTKGAIDADKLTLSKLKGLMWLKFLLQRLQTLLQPMILH
jgi:Na+/H+-translocating membrane pyrophosphatase